MNKIFSVIIILMLMVISVGSSFAQEKVEPPKKIHVLYLEKESSYILQDVEGVDFNGIKCLKGQHVNMTWVKNRTVYIPVDKIAAIVEYDSIELYKKDVESFNQKRLDSD